MHSPYFKNINYTSSNEDNNSEIRALDIHPGNSVLCVTGSGDRVLNLVAMNPGKITAIDVNPLQNYLLELKIACLRKLSREHALIFLGIKQAQKGFRKDVFYSLKNELSEKAGFFWTRNLDKIEKGVYYQGVWDKYIQYMGKFYKLAYKKQLDQIFDLDDLDQQKRIYHKLSQKKYWKIMQNLFYNKLVNRIFSEDPAYFRDIPLHINFYRYLKNCEKRLFSCHSAKNNYILSLMIYGCYQNLNAVPPYLAPDNYEKTCDLIKKVPVEIICEDVSIYAGSGIKIGHNKFSLSDISSCKNQKEFLKLLISIVSKASAGAIICCRHLIRDNIWPDDIKDKVEILADLEKELFQSDLACCYTFQIGRKI